MITIRLVAFSSFALMLVDGASANSLQSNASQQAESTLLDNADSEASSENTDEELGQEDEEPDCD